MKKIILMLTVVMLVVILAACGKSGKDRDDVISKDEYVKKHEAIEYDYVQSLDQEEIDMIYESVGKYYRQNATELDSNIPDNLKEFCSDIDDLVLDDCDTYIIESDFDRLKGEDVIEDYIELREEETIEVADEKIDDVIEGLTDYRWEHELFSEFTKSIKLETKIKIVSQLSKEYDAMFEKVAVSHAEEKELETWLVDERNSYHEDVDLDDVYDVLDAYIEFRDEDVLNDVLIKTTDYINENYDEDMKWVYYVLQNISLEYLTED